jgi:ribose transport system substrate-binding protein
MVAFRGEYAGNVVTDYSALLRILGAAKADWIIARTHGLARVVQLKEDEFLVLKYIREGFEQELATCKTCQIVKTVDFTLADYGSGLSQKVQGAILQHPEANAVLVPYDTAMLAVAPAILESGRSDKLEVMGGEGFPTNIQLIRDNKGQDGACGSSAPWLGYAAVDTLNSVFHGQAPQDSGVGVTLIDREHNLPPQGKGFESKVDFRSAYLKAWGIAR